MNSRWKNAMIGLFHFLLLTGQKENRDRKRYAGNKENFQEICE